MSRICPVVCPIVPPYLLENIARNGSAQQRVRATRALALDLLHRGARAGGGRTVTAPPAGTGPDRTVSTADNTETLPGRVVKNRTPRRHRAIAGCAQTGRARTKRSGSACTRSYARGRTTNGCTSRTTSACTAATTPG